MTYLTATEEFAAPSPKAAREWVVEKEDGGVYSVKSLRRVIPMKLPNRA
jgi:hypothetical protein